MESIFVGIDVAKASLDLQTYPASQADQFENSWAGIRAILRHLRPDRIALIVVEASGGYETALVAELAAAGLPVPAADHAVRAAHMALDMIDALAVFNERNGYALQLRIGINSGAVVAGVIGKRKFIYDLWGDAVNTASRMESHGVAGRVQVTEATRRLLGEPFLFEERGVIAIKDMGEMHTWFLTGRSIVPSE